jgi:Ca2+/Na+ antiporter
MKKEKVTPKEVARRNNLFMWTVFVIVVNFIQVLFKNWLTGLVAMVGTIYALYRVVVYDNPKNRLSQKYYDWRGNKINK